MVEALLNISLDDKRECIIKTAIYFTDHGPAECQDYIQKLLALKVIGDKGKSPCADTARESERPSTGQEEPDLRNYHIENDATMANRLKNNNRDADCTNWTTTDSSASNFALATADEQSAWQTSSLDTHASAALTEEPEFYHSFLLESGAYFSAFMSVKSDILSSSGGMLVEINRTSQESIQVTSISSSTERPRTLLTSPIVQGSPSIGLSNLGLTAPAPPRNPIDIYFDSLIPYLDGLILTGSKKYIEASIQWIFKYVNQEEYFYYLISVLHYKAFQEIDVASQESILFKSFSLHLPMSPPLIDPIQKDASVGHTDNVSSPFGSSVSSSTSSLSRQLLNSVVQVSDDGKLVDLEALKVLQYYHQLLRIFYVINDMMHHAHRQPQLFVIFLQFKSALKEPLDLWIKEAYFLLYQFSTCTGVAADQRKQRELSQFRESREERQMLPIEVRLEWTHTLQKRLNKLVSIWKEKKFFDVFFLETLSKYQQFEYFEELMQKNMIGQKIENESNINDSNSSLPLELPELDDSILEEETEWTLKLKKVEKVEPKQQAANNFKVNIQVSSVYQKEKERRIQEEKKSQAHEKAHEQDWGNSEEASWGNGDETGWQNTEAATNGSATKSCEANWNEKGKPSWDATSFTSTSEVKNNGWTNNAEFMDDVGGAWVIPAESSDCQAENNTNCRQANKTWGMNSSYQSKTSSTSLDDVNVRNYEATNSWGNDSSAELKLKSIGVAPIITTHIVSDPVEGNWGQPEDSDMGSWELPEYKTEKVDFNEALRHKYYVSRSSADSQYSSSCTTSPLYTTSTIISPNDIITHKTPLQQSQNNYGCGIPTTEPSEKSQIGNWGILPENSETTHFAANCQVPNKKVEPFLPIERAMTNSYSRGNNKEYSRNSSRDCLVKNQQDYLRYNIKDSSRDNRKDHSRKRNYSTYRNEVGLDDSEVDYGTSSWGLPEQYETTLGSWSLPEQTNATLESWSLPEQTHQRSQKTNVEISVQSELNLNWKSDKRAPKGGYYGRVEPSARSNEYITQFEYIDGWGVPDSANSWSIDSSDNLSLDSGIMKHTEHISWDDKKSIQELSAWTPCVVPKDPSDPEYSLEAITAYNEQLQKSKASTNTSTTKLFKDNDLFSERAAFKKTFLQEREYLHHDNDDVG